MASRTDQAQTYALDKKSYGIGATWRRSHGWFWAGAVLTWIGCVVIAGALVYVLPKDYAATIRLEIMRESQSFEVFLENSTATHHEFEDHATFMRNEVLKLMSAETLYKVIDELQLVKKWEDAKSRPDAFRMLTERVQVEHHPGSSIVDITVLHSDPREAADLANAIGNAYKNRRTETETSRSNSALDMLNAQETLQEQKVEDSRQRMIELMEKFDIVDLGTQSNIVAGSDTVETGSRKSVTEARTALLKAEAEVSATRTRIDTMASLGREMRLEWLRQNGRLSVHGMHALDESEKLHLKLAMIQSSRGGDTEPQLGPSELEEVQRKLRVLTLALTQIDKNHQALMTTELEIEVKSLRNLSTIVESKKDDAMKERKSYTQYVEARRAYMAQDILLHEMRQSLLREKVDLSLPKSPIEVHQNAEADQEPVPEKVKRLSSMQRSPG